MPKTFQDKGSSKITLSDGARSSARAEAVFASFTVLTISVPIVANVTASVFRASIASPIIPISTLSPCFPPTANASSGPPIEMEKPRTRRIFLSPIGWSEFPPELSPLGAALLWPFIVAFYCRPLMCLLVCLLIVVILRADGFQREESLLV